MWEPRAKFKTVDEMWKECVNEDKKLLSDYSGSFWEFYITNHVRLDALFRQMFVSFTYFLQSDDEDLPTVTDNFIDAVYNHLLINHKKYEELYRVEVLADINYDFNKNYNVTESSSRTTSGTHSDTIGSRSDSSSVTYGQRTDETTKIMGQRSDSTSDTKGSRSDSTTLNKGTHEDTHEHDVSPDDSEDFYNHRKDTDNYGAAQDTTQFTEGSQTDSSSFTKGAETDTDTLVKGSETDTSTATKGQQLNSGTNSGTDTYAMTKSGIVGNITPAKLIEQHTNYWKFYNFYKYIFQQISEELLMV